jgi:GNAT superfamily N-acetyltransferase
MTSNDGRGVTAGRPTAYAAATRDAVVLAWQRLRWNLRGRGPRELAREIARSTWRNLAYGDEFVFAAAADVVSADTSPRRRPPRRGHSLCRYARREDIPAAHVAALRACIAKKAMPEAAVDHYLDGLLSPLEHGAEMWVGLADGVPAAWLFTTRDPVQLQREFPMFPLSKDDAVLFAAHTDPVWRGRGLSTILVRESCTQLAREGARRFYARVKTWNFRSANGLRREGFREAGIVRPLTLFGRSIAIWRPWGTTSPTGPGSRAASSPERRASG